MFSFQQTEIANMIGVQLANCRLRYFQLYMQRTTTSTHFHIPIPHSSIFRVNCQDNSFPIQFVKIITADVESGKHCVCHIFRHSK